MSNKQDDDFTDYVNATLDKSVSDLDDDTVERLAAIRQKVVSQQPVLANEKPHLKTAPRAIALRAIAASILLMVITVPMFQRSEQNESIKPDQFANNIAADFWQEDPDFLDAMEMLAVLGDEA